MKKKYIRRILLISVLILASNISGNFVIAKTFQSEQNQIETELDILRDWNQSGRHQEVLNRCEELLEKLITSTQLEIKSDVLTIKGTALRELNQFDAAITQHQNALEIRKKILGENAEKVANSNLNLGNCFFLQKKIKEAEACFLIAKKIKESIFSINATELLGIYNSLGNFYSEINNFQGAEYYLNRSLKIAKGDELSFEKNIVAAHISLANFWYDFEFPDSAIFYLERALDFQSENLAEQAMIYNNLGNAFAQKGSYSKAIEYLNIAFDFYKDLGPNYNLKSGATLLNMGNIFLEEGNTQNALLYFDNALQFSVNELLQQAQIYNSKGLAYLYLGEMLEARSAFRESINLYQSLSEAQEVAIELGDVFSNLGKCFFKEDQLKPTEFYYKKALDIYEKNETNNSKTAYALMKLSAVYIRADDFHVAKKNLNRAGTLLNVSSNLSNLSLAKFTLHFYWGKFWEKQNQWNKSEIAYQTALDVLKKITPDADVFLMEHIEIFAALGKVKSFQNTSKDWKEGLIFIEKSLAVLNQLKGNLDDVESEMDIQNTFYNIYNTGIEICEKLANQESKYQLKAFDFTENYRGNILKKLSQKAKIQPNLSIPKNLIAEETKLQNAFLFYKKRKYELSNVPYFEVSKIAKLDSTILEVVRQKKQLQAEIKKQYPKYFQLLYEYPKTTIADIQENLAPNQSLLLFQWGEKKIWSYVINPDTFFIRTIPNTIELNQVLAELSGLYQVKTHLLPTDRKEFVFKKFVTLSHQLFQVLIEPIEPHLKKTLTIIPDGPLHYLPFELLIREPAEKNRYFRGHDYLLNHNAIQYHYATGFLFPKKDNNTFTSEKILTIAPRFEHSTLGLSPLNHNKLEANLIHELLGGTIWKAGEDSENSFIEEVEKYSIFHLSTHGILNNEQPEFSYLAFSENPNSKEQEQLFVAEIYNLPMRNTEMIVLSACQTASGKLYRGEGLLSLSHAFSFAGAKSLVASFWNVDDSHTPELMRFFYENLQAGKSKSAAMQQAKIDYLKTASQDEAYPYYWAGFMVIGDDTPIDRFLNDDYWNWFLGFSFFVIVLFFLWRRRY